MIGVLYKSKNEKYTNNVNKEENEPSNNLPEVDLSFLGPYLSKIEKVHQYAPSIVVDLFDAIFNEDIAKLKQILDVEEKYSLKEYMQRTQKQSKLLMLMFRD